MKRFSTLFLALQLQSAYGAVNRFKEIWSTDQYPLYEGDQFMSPNWYCKLYLKSGQLSYWHPYLHRFNYNCPNSYAFKPTSNGQIRIFTSTGNDCYIGPSGLPSGSYGLIMGDDCQIHIYNGKGQKVYTTGTNVNNMDWSYKAVARKNWVCTWDVPQPSVSYKPKVVLLDTYSDPNAQWYEWSLHSEEIINTITDYTAKSTFEYSGYPLNVGFDSSTFNEWDFINALKRNYVDNYSYQRSVIINFSGVFRDPTSLAINCAIQWSFYAGHLVVAAAGNSNTRRDFRNPFQFLVGGADYDRFSGASQGKVWSDSSYGNALDIWAPVAFRLPFARTGTSVSTAIVTSAFVQAHNTWGWYLNKNPGRAMKYISALARTDFLPSSDPKVAASPFAGTRFLDTSRISSTKPCEGSYLPSSVPNYCANLGLPNAARGQSDWYNLLNKANTNKLGDLVSSVSVGMQYCGTSYMGGFTSMFCR